MKRILVTRPRTQADSFVDGLKAVGFEPIYFPVIEIHPIEDNPELDRALKNINKYDWVVFTSVNGVEVVSEKLKQILSITARGCHRTEDCRGPESTWRNT